jgi:hypothetical protein
MALRLSGRYAFATLAARFFTAGGNVRAIFCKGRHPSPALPTRLVSAALADSTGRPDQLDDHYRVKTPSISREIEITETFCRLAITSFPRRMEQTKGVTSSSVRADGATTLNYGATRGKA